MFRILPGSLRKLPLGLLVAVLEVKAAVLEGSASRVETPRVSVPNRRAALPAGNASKDTSRGFLPPPGQSVTHEATASWRCALLELPTYRIREHSKL